MIKEMAFRSPETMSDPCPICLCAMSKGETLCRLLCKAQHVFHKECIVEWLSTSSRCCPIDHEDLSADACLSA